MKGSKDAKEAQRKPLDTLVKNKGGTELTEQQLDKAAGGAPNLMQACASGRHFKKATLTT
jgi:type VI protein secretion system component Hcp